MKRFPVHFGLIHVPCEGKAFSDGMIWKERGDVSRRAIGSVGGKNATGQCERPFALTGFFEEGSDAIGCFWNAPPRPIVQGFQCGVLSLGLRD